MADCNDFLKLLFGDPKSFHCGADKGHQSKRASSKRKSIRRQSIEIQEKRQVNMVINSADSQTIFKVGT